MSELLRLLFVGINEETRKSIRQSLKQAHFRVQDEIAGTGAKAYDLLEARDFHFIILDASLPDQASLAWLEVLRASGYSRPVLLLGSPAPDTLNSPSLHQGATDFIPLHLLSAEVIGRTARQLLTIHRLEQQRLLAEDQLNLNKERLREAQKMARLGNWELNLDTKELIWSEEMYQILEWDPSIKPDFDTVNASIHPQDRALYERVITEALKKKKHYQAEYRMIMPGGRIKYTTAQGYPVLDPAGQVTGISGTLQDISDRVSTRNALKESEKRYLMLLETMTEGVLHVDNDQRILFANKSFCQMMGYSKQEVIGQSFYRFLPNGPSREVIEQKSVLRHQLISDQYELELVKKDGTPICLLVGASPQQDENGQVTGSLGTFTDISERKKIEEALQSSEKLFRTLFEDAQAFLCTHTLDGTLLSINKAGARMAGLAPEALQGKNFRQLVAPEAESDFAAYLAIIRQQHQATGIFRIINQVEDTFHYIVYRNILYQESGKEPYVIVSAQDITDRISVEEELRQAKLVAENSVKVKEQFLANISHEIRTPMNGIIGLTGVLQKMIAEEEQKGYLKAIQSSADKLLIIINDILDFSKIEAGKLEFEKTEFSPRRVLQESMQLFEAKAAEKNNKLKVIIDADVPQTVVGDPGKLSQILNNLLSNATKFTQQGQIRVYLELVAELPDAYQMEFQVQDTGIGIPENKLLSIFDSFTQGSSDTTRKYGGTGLGLTICKQIVELQGGSIQVKSKPNQGSTFTFTLSFMKAQHSCEESWLTAAPVQVNPGDLGRLRILLAEDNQINQLLVRKVTRDWGYELDIAENGVQALTMFRENHYDIILMDMQMPEMDGYEAMAVIRNSAGPEKATPIIALTAHASQREAAKCLEAGADIYVSKPFKPDELLTHIAVLVRKNPAFQVSAPEAAQKDAAESNPGKYINLQYLEEMAEGDQHFIAEILSMFVEQTPRNLEHLQAFSREKDWKGVKALAHKMKSSVVMIGNQELEEIFVNLQLFATSEQQAAQIPELISQATEICQGAIAAIQAELRELV
ncbi:MAG: PAS domain S-box protein [Adhaeribacter sp.]